MNDFRYFLLQSDDSHDYPRQHSRSRMRQLIRESTIRCRSFFRRLIKTAAVLDSPRSAGPGYAYRSPEQVPVDTSGVTITDQTISQDDRK